MFDSCLDSEQMFGQHGSMHRTYVRRRLTLLAAVISVLAVGVPAAGHSFAGGGEAAGADRQTGTSYVIREGDTLWNLARRMAPAEDPRLVVDRIADANDIVAGDLTPGQRLMLPAA